MIDLSPGHLELVVRILSEHVPDCEIRVFGSRVAGTAKHYSDLDLAVVANKPLEPDRLRHLKEAFEDSTLPIRVDVLDWHLISDSFRKVIERQFVILQQRRN